MAALDRPKRQATGGSAKHPAAALPAIREDDGDHEVPEASGAGRDGAAAGGHENKKLSTRARAAGPAKKRVSVHPVASEADLEAYLARQRDYYADVDSFVISSKKAEPEPKVHLRYGGGGRIEWR